MNDSPDTDRTASPEPEALTPEARAILDRARRSFGISIGILLLGFMAIAFALVYRAMRDAPAPQIAAAVELPAGAELVSAVLAEGRVNVTYRLGDAAVLALFDAENGASLGQITLAGD